MVLSPLGPQRGRGRGGGHRVPRPGGMRMGDLQARRHLVRLGRGRARRADLPDPRAGALLWSARLRGHSLRAARPRAPCWSSPAGGAPGLPCSRCWRSRGCCAPRRGSSPALYWLYLIGWVPSFARAPLRALRGRAGAHAPTRHEGPWRHRSRQELALLTLLAASAPLVWLLSDLVITGNPLWSLTNTRHTASTLRRVSGITNVPQYIPRRIGEILRPPAACGRRPGRDPLTAVAAPPGPAGRRRRRPRRPRLRRVRRAGSADQHALRVPRGRDPVRFLRRGSVRLDCTWSTEIGGGAGGWPAGLWCWSH